MNDQQANQLCDTIEALYAIDLAQVGESVDTLITRLENQLDTVTAQSAVAVWWDGK